MALLALAALLILPASALAATDDLKQAIDGNLGDTVPINTMWVVIAAVFVLFMQAGFAMLEVGFSRGKNAGTGVAKILTNLSIAAIGYWAVGFAFAFGSADVFGSGSIIGSNGFLLQFSGNGSEAFPVMGLSTATVEAKFLFQFAFCAVSLAIVWGTTLERIKYGAYVIYAIVFATIIYPIGSHWVFGGGWLQTGDTGLLPTGMQDFAGSTAVHLIGASGALAALLLLGPRKGKYGPDGKPRVIPGHSMPLAGLGVVILFFGWFGFNPGSTLGTDDARLAEVAVVTLLGGAGGVIGSFVASQIRLKTIDIGMVGNGMIAGLVAITAPSGYVEAWAAPIIGFVGGLIVVFGVIAIDKKLDDPIGALSAHGLAGIWGTLSCGFFTAPRLAEYNAFGNPEGGLLYGGGPDQLIAQAVGVLVAFTFVFAMSYITFAAIKATIGLRVTDEQEDAGLDIVEHGMYGYPEQFIPPAEFGAASTGPAASGA
ncbi:MAG: ammonium transporter, partial [Thermoleophilaceae bacterium]|nr:ammonium transporter [Thermoleophilaceae bacterium]